jgi:hypothetical protein
MRSIKGVVLGFGAFEKVKFHKAWHLFEMAVARQPHMLES